MKLDAHLTYQIATSQKPPQMRYHTITADCQNYLSGAKKISVVTCSDFPVVERAPDTYDVHTDVV